MVARPVIDRRVAIAGAVTAIAMAAAAAAGRTRDAQIALPDGRIVPVRITVPAGRPRSLLLFSHGANSAPHKYDRLTGALAAAGHGVGAPLHADSPDHPGGGRIAREDGVPMRLADMRGIIAQRAALGIESGPVIAAGHSYGALIAQMLGGAGGMVPADVAAVLAWSPPGPFPPAITAETWKTVARPMLVQTGTADVLPMMAPTWDVHRVSHDAAPGPGVLFVGAGVDHYFGNIICRPERSEAPQAVQFADAVAVSLAFLDRTLAGQSLAGLARAQVPGQSWIEVKG